MLLQQSVLAIKCIKIQLAIDTDSSLPAPFYQLNPKNGGSCAVAYLRLRKGGQPPFSSLPTHPLPSLPSRAPVPPLPFPTPSPSNGDPGV
jgi:hypothetical protein